MEIKLTTGFFRVGNENILVATMAAIIVPFAFDIIKYYA